MAKQRPWNQKRSLFLIPTRHKNNVKSPEDTKQNDGRNPSTAIKPIIDHKKHLSDELQKRMMPFSVGSLFEIFNPIIIRLGSTLENPISNIFPSLLNKPPASKVIRPQFSLATRQARAVSAPTGARTLRGR